MTTKSTWWETFSVEQTKCFFPTDIDALHEIERRNSFKDYCSLNSLYGEKNPIEIPPEKKTAYQKLIDDVQSLMQSVQVNIGEGDTAFILSLRPDFFPVDCLVSIFSYLRNWELARIRRVCQWFNQVASLDYLWYWHWERDVGYCVEKDLPIPSFHRYMNLTKQIPLVIKEDTDDQKPMKKPPLLRFIERVRPDTSHSLMSLDMTSKEIYEKPHKLAIIMAIFNENQYIPRLYHYFRVGYSPMVASYLEEDGDVFIPPFTITLLKFCYAILTETERDLYPLNMKIEQSNEPHSNFSANEDTFDRRGLISVGIGPNIASEFDPWIFYLHIEGYAFNMPIPEILKRLNTIYLSDTILSRVNNIPMRITENEQQEEYYNSCYEWISDEKSWASGIMYANAGFRWFYSNRYYTVYDQRQKQMIVIKKEKILYHL